MPSIPNSDNSKADARTMKRKIGDLGEEIACRFLMKHKFRIICRNYLKKYGELDIVAYKLNKIHFIEVKSVTRENFSNFSNIIDKNVNHETYDSYKPEDNIHPWKLRRLSKTIRAYISENKLLEKDWEFSIITVFLDFKTKKAKINFIENIII